MAAADADATAPLLRSRLISRSAAPLGHRLVACLAVFACSPLGTGAVDSGPRGSGLIRAAAPSSELELGRGQQRGVPAGGDLPPPWVAADAAVGNLELAGGSGPQGIAEQGGGPASGPLSAEQGEADEDGSGDPDVMGDMARAIWGSSNWPPAGEPGWPAEVQEAAGTKEIEERTMLVYMEWILVVLSFLCCASVVALRTREAAAIGVAVAKAPAEAALLAPGAIAPGAAPSCAYGGVEAGSGDPVAAPGFASQFSALACAICWRHMHLRAMAMHLLRFALPVLSLALMHYLQGWLVHQFTKPDWAVVLSKLGISSPTEAVDAIMEYTFTVMLLYLALTSLSNFTWHVASESETGFRRLLHVSGLSRSAYLAATAGVDGLLQSVVCMGIMALIAQGVLRLRLVIWTSPALVLAVFVLVASTATLLGYLIHFPFRSARSAHTAAQLLVMFITFTAPFTPLNPVVPLQKAGGQSWKVLALPTLPAYDCLFELARGCAKGRCLVFSDFGPAWSSHDWVYPSSMVVGIGGDKDRNPTPPVAIICYVGLLSLQLALGWSAVALLDRSRLPELHKAVQEPASASAENGRLPVLEARDLAHCYGWLPAATGAALPASGQLQDRVLDGVSFSAPAGATLGLLGPNGAGKTTAIRCITGEERPVAGAVYIRPMGVGGGVDGGPATIGLCPQETVLNEDLTVGENILLFARVRGLSGPAATAAAVRILSATRLQEKHDWMPGTLSGGMRRRLCVACAMVASPAVVILDEPTTGLDPLSRRGIWSTVGEIKAAGGCCLLTTHMLEEAEALCTNLVILRKGSIAAEGSVQQLKQEWGTGYVLNVDLQPGDEEKARAFLAAMLPEGSKEPVKAAARGQLTFKVPGDAHVVGRLFIELAETAEANGVRRWGVSQASLEDAYLRIISKDDAQTA